MNNSSTTELTFRGVLLGALITLIFTASNIYLGLKVGMTFASSIPAAVISMAVLRMFKNSSILENNIVQTQASAAGCLSSVIFIFPSLLMIGYWNSIPLMEVFLLCATGGILGVIFTIPLRYAMVVKSSLPYPEGIAAAEILKTGQQENRNESKKGVLLLFISSLISGGFSLCTNGFRIFVDTITLSTKVGSACFSLGVGFSFAMLGAGLLIGLGAGLSLLLGIAICWGVAIPWMSSVLPVPDGLSAEDFINVLWAQKLRFAGAGCIAISAIWTLFIYIKPIINGLIESSHNSKNELQHDELHTNISLRGMICIFISSTIIIMLTFYKFASAIDIPLAWTLTYTIGGTLMAVIIGFVLASACGYMAGLIGSSSSPISGISIISVIIIALSFYGIANSQGLFDIEGGKQFVTAMTLFASSAVIAIAAISNDNMQDLKTGLLVGASPRKQQIALIIGCIVGAIVIAPVIDLLYHSYGFTGAMPRENMDPAMALNAPQAVLMATLAKGIFIGDLDWTYILLGIILGIILIAFDAILKRLSHNKLFIAPLAVGLGIYLPSSVNALIIAGSVFAFLCKKAIRKQNNDTEDKEKQLDAFSRRSNLIAAGLIVGESMMGVIMAAILTISLSQGGSEAPLAINLGLDTTSSHIVSIVAFCALTFIVLRLVRHIPK